MREAGRPTSEGTSVICRAYPAPQALGEYCFGAFIQTASAHSSLSPAARSGEITLYQGKARPRIRKRQQMKHTGRKPAAPHCPKKQSPAPLSSVSHSKQFHVPRSSVSHSKQPLTPLSGVSHSKTAAYSSHPESAIQNSRLLPCPASAIQKQPLDPLFGDILLLPADLRHPETAFFLRSASFRYSHLLPALSYSTKWMNFSTSR